MDFLTDIYDSSAEFAAQVTSNHGHLFNDFWNEMRIDRISRHVFMIPYFPLIFCIKAFYVALQNRIVMGKGSLFQNFLYTFLGIYGGGVLERIVFGQPVISIFKESEILVYILICWLVFYFPYNMVFNFLSIVPLRNTIKILYGLAKMRSVVTGIGRGFQRYQPEKMFMTVSPMMVLLAIIRGAGGSISIALGRVVEKRPFPSVSHAIRPPIVYAIIYMVLAHYTVLGIKTIQQVMVVVSLVLIVSYDIFGLNPFSPVEYAIRTILMIDKSKEMAFPRHRHED